MPIRCPEEADRAGAAVSKQESTASEKAADRMHADLSAMLDDARRHLATTQNSQWAEAASGIQKARAAIVLCMSERDRRIASR